jgi:hypothetical protein
VERKANPKPQSAPEREFKKVGQVARDALPENANEGETDGMAIRLSSDLFTSSSIFPSLPVKPLASPVESESGKKLCYSGANSGNNFGISTGVVEGREEEFGAKSGKLILIRARQMPAEPGDSGAPVWNCATHRSVGLIAGLQPGKLPTYPPWAPLSIRTLELQRRAS